MNLDENQENLVRLGQHPVETTDKTFASLGLDEEILKSVQQVGFKHPSAIQAAVIPLALTGKDLIGLAQTGSGKTAAFVIPLAARLLHGKGLRGLIVCPTREIALQTQAFLEIFGKHHQLSTACIIGGTRMGAQIRALKKDLDIIVATPGRLLDHIKRKNVSLKKISSLVLDEADHMLDLGFLPQLREIIKNLPRNRHTMMFSATMPADIERLARQHLKDPERIDILPEGRAAEGIKHRLYLVDGPNKKKCLLAMLKQELGSTLVFTRRKIDANGIYHILADDGHPVTTMHSDKSQRERVQALEGFRSGKFRVLVATDIASRGIDVANIQHIINFNIPQTVEEYIHRAGRTARMKTQGMVSTIATWKDKDMITEIETTLGEKLPRCTIAGIEPYVEIKVKRPVKKARW